MFGHQDEENKQQTADPQVVDTTNPVKQADPGAQLHDTAITEPSHIEEKTADAPEQNLKDDGQWQHPGVKIDEPTPEAKPIDDIISPAGGYPRATSNQMPTGNSDEPKNPLEFVLPADNDDQSKPVDNELIAIKQKALNELLPLIDKLDQTPDEKFKTLMMMIQASDDQALIEKAYTSAHSIEDEKVRAQALLDIVNEINYFTQQTEKPE
ncbi:MAG: hypothetical protein NVS1B10_04190 [Candidatus Saccharimonadales bacterium]